ncbi:MAG: diguanylate cyclase [Alteromonadales bacterium]|nr:diguanylate cyclase [Alteromonadales bacterium]
MLKQVANTVGAYIYSKDLQGVYTYANQSMLELFKKPIEQVVGFDDSHFFDRDTYLRIQAIDQDVIHQAKKITIKESNRITSTGELRIYQSIKSPLYDEDGEIIGLCGISTDITEQIQLKKTIAEQKQLLDIVLNNIDAHVYMKSEDRHFLYANDKVAELFGLPVSDIVGSKETDILPAEMAAHFYESDQKVFATNQTQRTEETATDEQGVEHHYLSVKVPIIQNEQRALIGFSTDISKIYKMKEQFKRLANTDHLTNLYNRRYFIKQGEREFSRARRYNKPFAIISLDIDHFKEVNNNFGHTAGDNVLKEVSRLLLGSIRKEDVLARIGGEEFTILLPETDLENSQVLAERIRNTIQNEIICYRDLLPISVTISLGLTLLNEKDNDFDEILVRVDEALYKAKTGGRNKLYCL